MIRCSWKGGEKLLPSWDAGSVKMLAEHSQVPGSLDFALVTRPSSVTPHCPLDNAPRRRQPEGLSQGTAEPSQP